MVLRITRAVAAVALATLFASSAVAVHAAEDSEPAADGRYIVVLEHAPLATYDGGARGIPATAPDAGEQLDVRAPAARRYLSYLARARSSVASTAQVQPDEVYETVLNGFSAQLTGDQVAALREADGVVGVYADEVRNPTASSDFLGLGDAATGAGGVWETLGGVAEAGKGVVVGVIDTGIASAHPSFAGLPLSDEPSDEPYLIDNDVVFDRADGGTFRATRSGGQGWSKLSYSTKLIAGHHFAAGARAAGFDFTTDALTPEDADGHGSLVASVAAGNGGVAASIGSLDLGAISGVAPAAKVASYKACWAGPDPAETRDDVCALSDLLAAVDTAVADGVDVISYPVSRAAGGEGTDAEELALLGAAAAGVFVAVSAGNDGASGVAAPASPWYASAAASTMPGADATVEMAPDTVIGGASLTVPTGTAVTGPAIYAGDIPVRGGAAADAALCLPNSLDRAAARGSIVVCDRGVNDRQEKSRVVAHAGGIGMVLVNVTPASVDADVHALPTVHVESTARDRLLAYVRGAEAPQLTLRGDDAADDAIPTPQIAEFSTQGAPALVDAADVRAPSVAAPGVGVLGAAVVADGRMPFQMRSGTSLAAAHVAGLGALYLAEHPTATPAEVISALMTTAYDTVDAQGTAVTDPFAQGAGQVDPVWLLDPGLVYLSDATDWAELRAAQAGDDADAAAAATNAPMIVVPELYGAVTVTRTVTATEPGTFSAFIDVPGVDATVEPSTLEFTAAGESRSYTVTFLVLDAEPGTWATGSLTWGNDDALTVRSPIAVLPITAP